MKKPSLNNNKNALKPASKRVSGVRRQLTCTPEEDAKWEKQAKSENMKVNPWIRKTLNEKIKNTTGK